MVLRDGTNVVHGHHRCLCNTLHSSISFQMPFIDAHQSLVLASSMVIECNTQKKSVSKHICHFECTQSIFCRVISYMPDGTNCHSAVVTFCLMPGHIDLFLLAYKVLCTCLQKCLTQPNENLLETYHAWYTTIHLKTSFCCY